MSPLPLCSAFGCGSGRNYRFTAILRTTKSKTCCHQIIPIVFDIFFVTYIFFIFQFVFITFLMHVKFFCKLAPWFWQNFKQLTVVTVICFNILCSTLKLRQFSADFQHQLYLATETFRRSFKRSNILCFHQHLITFNTAKEKALTNSRVILLSL